jgi:pilus assembly protein CpaD
MTASKILSACVFSVLLAACQVPEGPPPPPKKVEVMELDSRHAVSFVAGSAAVSEMEVARLEEFTAPLLSDNSAQVLVEMPRGVGDPLLERDRALNVVGVLADRGITSRLVELPESSPELVRVIVRRFTAVAPDCPDWETVKPNPYTNVAASNHGCATAQNLSVMIENPADLVEGRDSGNARGDANADAMKRLRNRTTPDLISPSTGSN